MSCAEKKTDEQVLEPMQERKNLWRHTAKRQAKTVGHILRLGGEPKTTIKSRVNSKKPKKTSLFSV